MKVCPSCGKKYAQSFMFCAEDGSPLRELSASTANAAGSNAVKGAGLSTAQDEGRTSSNRTEDHGRKHSHFEQRKQKSMPNRRADIDTRRLRMIAWSMIGVGCVLVVLIGIAFNSVQSHQGELAIPERLQGVIPTTGPSSYSQHPPNTLSSSNDIREVTLELASFFNDWKQSGSASDTEWIDTALKASTLAQLTHNDPQAAARQAYAFAEIEFRDGNLNAADEAFRQAAELLPSWSLPHNGRGKVAARRGNFERAAAFYRSAINKDPGWLFPRTNLLGALLQLRRYNDVAKEASETIAQHHSSAFAHYALAIAQGQLDRPGDAIGSGQAALRLDPQGRTGFDADELRQNIEWWRARTGDHYTGDIDNVRGTSPDVYISLMSSADQRSAREVVKIPPRTQLTLNNCQQRVLRIDGEFGNWCQTSVGSQTGWVFSGFVK